MRVHGPAARLTIYLDGTDVWHHKPLYTEIVHRAHQHGLAGATVIRGIDGFSATAREHRHHRFSLAVNTPVTIIIIDERQRIEAFLDTLDGVLTKAAIALDDVEVIRFLPEPRTAEPGE